MNDFYVAAKFPVAPIQVGAWWFVTEGFKFSELAKGFWYGFVGAFGFKFALEMLKGLDFGGGGGH